MTNVVFRKLVSSDISTVVNIERKTSLSPWSTSLFEQALSSNKLVLAVINADQVVGYGVVSFVVGEAELLNICIDPAAQGKGFGRQLLSELIDNVMGRGNVKDMYLEVRESNQVARGLYESEGFAEIGRRQRYYPTDDGREDAILMALPIAM